MNEDREIKAIHRDLFVIEYEDGSLDIGYDEKIVEQATKPVILQSIRHIEEDLV